MSDHLERPCRECGSLLHHADWCSCCARYMRSLRTAEIEVAERIVCPTCRTVLKDQHGLNGVVDLEGKIGVTLPANEQPLDPCHWGKMPKSAWQKPSRAVVASDGDGAGVVLWAVGPHVASEVEQLGNDLADLGLDDAPHGVSVWEGRTVGGEYSPHTGDYDSAYLEGKFRPPTEAEWAYILLGQCPWGEDEYFIVPEEGGST